MTKRKKTTIEGTFSDIAAAMKAAEKIFCECRDLECKIRKENENIIVAFVVSKNKIDTIRRILAN